MEIRIQRIFLRVAKATRKAFLAFTLLLPITVVPISAAEKDAEDELSSERGSIFDEQAFSHHAPVIMDYDLSL